MDANLYDDVEDLLRQIQLKFNGRLHIPFISVVVPRLAEEPDQGAVIVGLSLIHI